MLNGSYQHSMDAKGRVALPAPFRKVLPDKVTLVMGTNNALFVFAEDEFEKWLSSLFGEEGFDRRKKNHGLIELRIRGGAYQTSIDSAGRVNVPAGLRESAGLTKAVTVIGMGDHLEIWDTERWNDFMNTAPTLDELLFQQDK